jgi:eukaryotic-like serine/threonine-protein kinase
LDNLRKEEEMMENQLCPNCGSANADDAKFCINCGTDLKTFQTENSPKKKSTVWIWVVGVVGIFMVCIILVIILYFTGDKIVMGISNIFATSTPTPTNTSTPTPTFTPTPTLGIGSTNLREKDGMLEIFVPAGSFMMGDTSSTADSNEKPIHKVTLDAFWIDQTEVTNGMYRACVDAGVCDRPSSIKSKSHSNYWDNSAFDNYPVINVTWRDANDYCRWMGARLPSEAEWEFAARGENSFMYPWGNNSPTSSLANYGDNLDDTTSVGSYPDGSSPYGALDMAGNVYEWVNDWYDNDYYEISPSFNPPGPTSGSSHVTRGGSYDMSSRYIRTANRNLNSSSRDDIGFRCANDGTNP